MKLTPENYHCQEANQTYMSVSQYKQFRSCEARALAEIRGEYCRPVSTAMMVGSYIDAYFSGELEDFIGNNQQIISSQGKTKGELKSEFRQAKEIVSRLEQDPFFMRYVTGDPQRIFTGEIEGVPFRVKLDFLFPDKIVDLKSIKDFGKAWSDDEGRYIGWIRAWGYDIQGAVYQAITAQATGERLPFYLAAATKEPVMDKAVIQIADHVLDTRLAEVEALAPGFQAIKLGLAEPTRCEKCDYCKSTKRLTETILYEGE